MKWILSLFVCVVGLIANPNVTVSIIPQKYFVEKIAGDTVTVNLMVQPGSDPETYEPKPQQMASLEKSDIYFAIGVPFEDVWLERFKKQFPALFIAKTEQGIEKIAMAAHHHHEHEDHADHKDHDHEEHADHDHEHEEHADHKDHDHEEHADHDHEEHADHKDHDHEEHADHDHEHHHHHHEGMLDPHIWLDPILVKTQANNIYNALVQKYPKNKELYKTNLDKFLAQIDTLHGYLTKKLEKVKGEKFMVYHPAWGYFAKRYGLVQESIELEGKEPKPKALEGLINEAKEEGIHTIFVQPQFSQKSAKLIAKAINGRVVSMSPLSFDWEQGLKDTADVLTQSMK